MDKIEITPELLADLKAKAEKATPGPWCTCLTAEKIMGRKYPDWGCIYANVQNSETGEILEGCQLAAVNQWLASEEEKDAAREKYFKEGIETNPGLMGANAAYIAAANPSVILALIEDYENKQQALYGMFLLVKQLKVCLNLDTDAGVEEAIQGAISRINALDSNLSGAINALIDDGRKAVEAQYKQGMEYLTPRLKWTRTHPTKTGFYFYKNIFGNIHVLEFNPPWVDFSKLKGEWAGPIPEPTQ